MISKNRKAMQNKRRIFLQNAGLLAAGSLLMPQWACQSGTKSSQVPRDFESRPAANNIRTNWSNYRTFRRSSNEQSSATEVPDVFTISQNLDRSPEELPPKYEDLFPEEGEVVGV